MNHRGVVVGVDGSAPSTAALRWAVSEADLRSVPLTVCHVGWLPQGQELGTEAASPAGTPGSDIVSAAARLSRQIAPGVTVHGCRREGPPADGLLQIAEECELLVLGVRGAGAWGGLGLGSVSSRVAAHARKPVVFAHGDGSWQGERVVVGVDDSAAAEAAAGFAFQEAALRQVPLTAVLSWWITPLPVRGGYLSLASAEGSRGRGDHPTYGEEMRRLAEDRLKQVLTPWRSKFPAVDVTSALRTDAPPRALHDAAGRAGLLVIGSRGLGPIRRLLLGSVGHAVLQHPPCSVAIVHSRY
jgi:nucleotide-binding universal stress UspA family protein